MSVRYLNDRILKKISYVFRSYKGDLDEKLHAIIFLNFEVLLKRLCLVDSLDKKSGFAIYFRRN